MREADDPSLRSVNHQPTKNDWWQKTYEGSCVSEDNEEPPPDLPPTPELAPLAAWDQGCQQRHLGHRGVDNYVSIINYDDDGDQYDWRRWWQRWLMCGGSWWMNGWWVIDGWWMDEARRDTSLRSKMTYFLFTNLTAPQKDNGKSAYYYDYLMVL